MRNPTRWRDPDGGADAETRAILSSHAGVEPSREEVSRIWAGLESHLHLAPGSPPPPIDHTAATPGAGALAAKITLAVVLVSAAGFGLHRLQVRDAEPAARATPPAPSTSPRAAGRAAEAVAPPRLSPPSESAGTPPAKRVAGSGPAERATVPPASTRASSPRRERATRSKSGEHTPSQVGLAPVTAELARAPQTESEAKPLASSWTASQLPSPTPAAPETAPAVAAAGPQEPPLPVNQLLEESRQLERARAALRAGAPDRALAILAAVASRNTSLAQEREALTIEAMAAKPGLRAKATVRARAFLVAYPDSPYRAQIRPIALDRQ